MERPAGEACSRSDVIDRRAMETPLGERRRGSLKDALARLCAGWANSLATSAHRNLFDAK
jgi:hypothetical protein